MSPLWKGKYCLSSGSWLPTTSWIFTRPTLTMTSSIWLWSTAMEVQWSHWSSISTKSRTNIMWLKELLSKWSSYWKWCISMESSTEIWRYYFLYPALEFFAKKGRHPQISRLRNCICQVVILPSLNCKINCIISRNVKEKAKLEI